MFIRTARRSFLSSHIGTARDAFASWLRKFTLGWLRGGICLEQRLIQATPKPTQTSGETG